MARRRDEAMRAAELSNEKVSLGSRGQAARSGDTYCAWGFPPSPLAMKVAENTLSVCSAHAHPTGSSGTGIDGTGIDGAGSNGAGSNGAGSNGAGSNGAGSQGTDIKGRRRLVFYVCYAGTHSSILAASLHLGILDNECSICDLPFFDRRVSSEIGVPVLVGRDSSEAEVYALGTGWLSAPLERAVCDLVELGCPEVSVCMCAVRGLLDFPARVGGFASRRCKLIFPGRALIAESLRRKVPEMRRAVQRCLDLSAKWKDNEGQPKGEVIWVDGSKAGRIGPPS